jgi:Zn-dependent oligopeptidase
MSQTLLFIEKHEFTLDELQNMAEQKPRTMQNIKDEIVAVDDKLQQISLLQRHIGTYGKTKELYKQFKQSKNKEQFKQENIKAITDHEAAKTFFDEHGFGFGSDKKLPTIKELREEYAKLNTDKKILWAKYHETKNGNKEIDNAWANVRTLLNIKDDAMTLRPEEATPKKCPKFIKQHNGFPLLVAERLTKSPEHVPMR